jgi:prepilin-type N-terminal cleavage/methylation domain-containing protein
MKGIGMRTPETRRGVTLIELMVAVSIFSLMVVVIFSMLATAQRSMKSDMARDAAEGTGTRLIDRIGRDIRESSYAYVHAGDWLAGHDGTGAVAILVARNYFSASPATGGVAQVPGISDEGWQQCPNPACPWSNFQTALGTDPKFPNAILARPTRNNPQSGSVPSVPLSFAFSDNDARGRLFGHLAAGANCPFCDTALSTDAYFGGLLVFSPRRADRSYSYGGSSGYETRWESMIFYCPFRDPNTGLYSMRRYQFYAASLPAGASPPSLVDLLDFNGNGVIETPPMTRTDGTLALDAEGEAFHLQPNSGRNDLRYVKWDNAAGRAFEILVNRQAGTASVRSQGGAFDSGGFVTMNLEMFQFGLGVSDFDVSTFINNPSWPVGGNAVNPAGVMEPGVVRVTFQVDRPGPFATRAGQLGQEESVQTTMLRPQN